MDEQFYRMLEKATIQKVTAQVILFKEENPNATAKDLIEFMINLTK